jgi:hypothetical protein
MSATISVAQLCSSDGLSAGAIAGIVIACGEQFVSLFCVVF